MEIQFSNLAQSMKPSQIRNKIFDNPEMISFAAGKPDSNFFPTEEINSSAAIAFSKYGDNTLQYSDTKGFKDLRKMIVKQRMGKAGVNVTPDDITLISGAQQGIEFSAKLFINEGDAILCENPSYTGALSAFEAYNPQFIGVEMDEDGMVMEKAEEMLKKYTNIKMIYTIPNFQNPTGVTLSRNRRKKMAELASKYKVPIIEDDPYGDIIFNNNRHPSIKSFDDQGWVIYLGSFSKVFAPGLRLGWVCASESILKKYTLAKQNSDLQNNSLTEQFTFEFMKNYNLQKHIVNISNEYKLRRDIMLTSLKKYFPKEVKITSPEGGFFIWVELKTEIDTESLLYEAAEKQKVVFVPGKSFFTTEGNNNYIRLSYSSVNREEITEGIKRLGELITSYY